MTEQEFDDWSRGQKSRNWLRGLRFRRTNTDGWAFSRHWPHLLCWSWSVWLQPYRGEKYDGPRRFKFFKYRGNSSGNTTLTLWWLSVSVHWQDEKIAATGEPRIDWEGERARETVRKHFPDLAA